MTELHRGQRGNGMGGHSLPNDGASHEWYTPPHVFERLGIHFDVDVAAPATGVCFIKGRLTFVDEHARPAEHNSGAPSCLIAWGDANADALVESGLGMVFRMTAPASTAQASLFDAVGV